MLPPAALAIIDELVDAAPPLSPAQQHALQRIFDPSIVRDEAMMAAVIAEGDAIAAADATGNPAA